MPLNWPWGIDILKDSFQISVLLIQPSLHCRKVGRERTIFTLLQRIKVPVNISSISDDALCVSNYVWLKETLISKKQQTAECEYLYVAAKYIVCMFQMRWQNEILLKSGHLMLSKKSSFISKENLAISWFRLFISVVEAFDLAIVSVLQGNMDYEIGYLHMHKYFMCM